MASKNGLAVVRNALGLSNAPPKESPCRPRPPTMFSIDLERRLNKRQRKSTNYKLGVAIFDPQQPKMAVSTYSFVSGSSAYFSSKAPRFMFGQNFRVEKNVVGEFVKSLYPGSREAVLVAHDLRSEWLGLESLGISLPFAGGLDTGNDGERSLPSLEACAELEPVGEMVSTFQFAAVTAQEATPTLRSWRFSDSLVSALNLQQVQCI
jgi:hypothetical protein